MKEENIEIINFKLLSVIKSYEEVEKINLNEKYSLENLNLTEITGEAGSGKTQLCIYIIINTILPKSINYLEKGCLYISTVQKLPKQRLFQFIDFYGQKLSQK